MNSLRFEKRQLNFLSNILGCNSSLILYLCKNLEDYYSFWPETKKDKITGNIKTYADGTPKKRIIRPSYGSLKKIQRSIKTKILPTELLPKNIHGGVKKKSNITNAKAHQGNKYVFATDLQDFFPNINYKQVYSMFLTRGYSNYIAHWLTKLTTYAFELPQGTGVVL